MDAEDTIIQLYKELRSIRAVAARVDASRSKVHSIIKRAGLIDYSRPGAAGSKNKQAKLDEEKVREIRTSKEAISDLAKRYGVSDVCISKVKTSKTWRHVK
jgi:transposase